MICSSLVCRRGIMAKIRKSNGAVREARKPTWIGDKENQRTWNEKFISILRRDYANLDPAIHAILSDARRSDLCATMIRSYVDKGCTNWWYRESKSRGALYRRRLEQASDGLNLAAGLYLDRGDQATAQDLDTRARELLQVRDSCKKAFATKPHGRDRDHSFLLTCHSFLQTELRHSVTYATVAHLVNAGHEVEGNLPKELASEEQVRKNLTNFKRNVPYWHLYIAQ